MTVLVAEDEEVERLSRLYSALSRINQAIVRLPTRDELFLRVCQILAEDAGFSMAWIGLHNPATQIIEPVARWGDTHGYLEAVPVYTDGRPGGRGPTGAAFETGEVAFSNDLQLDEGMLPWRDVIALNGYRSAIALPVREAGQIRGTLNVYSDEIGFFQAREVALIKEVAVDLSFALDNHAREESRVRAEAALRDSEERFRATFEQRAVGIGHVALDGTFIRVNDRLCQITGFSCEELLQQPYFGLAIAEDRRDANQIRDEFQASLVSGVPLEQRFRHKDGSIYTASVAADLVRDQHGMPRYFVAVVTDITEREESVRQIAEQAGLLDQARDAIIVRNLDHRITYWSKGAERIFGWTAAEALGQYAGDLLHAAPGAFQAAEARVLEADAWSGEIDKLTKSGEGITVESRWTLVRDADGEPKSVLVIDTNITERKKLEVQFLRAQRMESIGTLAGGIAHDLNNVLAPILMSLELLKKECPADSSQELIGIVATSAQRGADMVKQVLQFARGVEGRRMSVQVKHVLQDIERIVRDTIPKNITLRTDIPGDLWSVMGDPTQVHQVLMNLCVNARDAMPSGGVLTLSAENVELDAHFAALEPGANVGEYVLLQVEDNGTGIPAQLLEKIFDPFFTTKAVDRGTGLGLSTSLAIVKSHGGLIRAYSELGKGTKFKVYFPALTTPHPEEADTVVAVMPHGHGELILVVDDEAAVREITRQTLEAFGYRVLLASDGAEAVAIFAAHKLEIAVVLTDMMMPVMDGAATILVLRRMQPTVRIIAASGLSATGNVGHAARLGVKHFIPKPYTAHTLLTVLRDILPPS